MQFRVRVIPVRSTQIRKAGIETRPELPPDRMGNGFGDRSRMAPADDD
jgi:hypothetical protein